MMSCQRLRRLCREMMDTTSQMPSTMSDRVRPSVSDSFRWYTSCEIPTTELARDTRP